MTPPSLPRPLPAVVGNDQTGELRRRVRAFLDEERAEGRFEPRVNSWMDGWDPPFSRRLAARGFAGMTVPTRYGGAGRTFLERFVITEELLAAGAPVAAHWFADRQVAPALLASGTEEQRAELLPGIAAGELSFAIGMSEPDSGSDLASVRTRAVRRDDGNWVITGTKVWTSGAHRADRLLLLARTAPGDPAARHAGLSQFVIDLATPGVHVRPVLSMDGEHHFNEVVLDQAVVPSTSLLGVEGEGWRQVTAELGFERSGPERFMSAHQLLEEAARDARGHDRARRGSVPADLGRSLARTAALRALSMSVAAAITAGEDPRVHASYVKLLGTQHEQQLVENASLEGPALDADGLRPHVVAGLLSRPTYTLRGGSNEVLRGIIAREIGAR
ncbi:acyl-CoA dehydrogenase [Streptomyces sp. AJS327]|uniref:acyl-CoA dehydrogenase family protein n=1 Tax=Streptomyces sp. AJS327 TaxID=2545265 RepID=UPI0015DFA03F|nr:acyl-CoA dehydrogenase family protein [Streptomyces sp. AJS327]MBA0050907.1 acyl-CoA dehydrogenase [Streptomyces sp. AJS327]